jgi:hypothetical protein
MTKRRGQKNRTEKEALDVNTGTEVELVIVQLRVEEFTSIIIR